MTQHTVTNSNDSGPDSLRQVVTNASSGDSIVFDAGLQEINLTSGQIEISSNINISGPITQSLVVKRDDSTGNVPLFRIFKIKSGSSVIINNLTISHGDIDGTVTSNGGGAIRNSGTLILNGCVFDSNNSGHYYGGGAIYNDANRTLLINNCEFKNNTTTGSGRKGGAIRNLGTINIHNSTFDNNKSESNSKGGAIYNDNILSIENSTFNDNITDGEGGAICTDTLADIVFCKFNANKARFGGAVFNNSNGSLNITYANIEGNIATEGGGLYNFNNMELVNSSIINNEANLGAGILNNGSNTNSLATVINTTISGNTVNIIGGGIYNVSNLELINCTITDNSSNMSYGAGVYTAWGTTTVGNTIIASNNPDNATGFTYNYLGGNFISSGFFGTDPELNPLALNGGFSENHLPKVNSPVINSGDNSIVATYLTTRSINTDQIGQNRISNGTVDIGSVETN